MQPNGCTEGIEMNAPAQHTTKTFFDRPVVQEKLKELLGKNAPAFATSVLQIVNSNSMLINADPQTVFSAACMAATLNLPINNNLGFAYIVPFKNNKTNTIEAQFQLGYKGFIQLAQRSGQFSRIAATPVYEGQLLSANPLLGYEFDWNIPSNGNPIGYVAFFKLLNGFTAELYMSKEEVQRHANKYSQTAKKGYGVWKDQFDAMALKTVLKLLLSKQAPLSIEMQTAQLADQTIVRDVDTNDFDYIDHNEEISNIEPPTQSLDSEMFDQVRSSIQSGDLDKTFVLSGEAGYVLTKQQHTELARL